jgi:hypothetical protein
MENAMCKQCEPIPSLWHAPGERYVACQTGVNRYDVMDTRTDRLVAVRVTGEVAITILKRLNSGKPTASMFGGLDNA